MDGRHVKGQKVGQVGAGAVGLLFSKVVRVTHVSAMALCIMHMQGSLSSIRISFMYMYLLHGVHSEE